ncbi:MAG: hypothetical protein HGA71_11075 [Azonexaceae bacterium]|nr:hypothetical protein [Azonexaceae bacterium]
MTELDTKTFQAVVEILRTAKPLFVSADPYLPVWSALGGAFIGAIASFIPNYLIAKRKERSEKRSTTLQLYSEIKATIEIAKHRQYIEALEAIEKAFLANQITEYSFEVQVPDDRYPIFKSSMERLGSIDIQIQVKVVEFYQLLEAVVQDVKPGGLLNSAPAPLNKFQEALRISKLTRQIGSEILVAIEKQYPECK